MIVNYTVLCLYQKGDVCRKCKVLLKIEKYFEWYVIYIYDIYKPSNA
jgi:hypothetical protein